MQIAHIGQAYLDTVTILANSIKGRNPYTFGHVDRVTKYAHWDRGKRWTRVIQTDAGVRIWGENLAMWGK